MTALVRFLSQSRDIVVPLHNIRANRLAKCATFMISDTNCISALSYIAPSEK